MKLTANLDSLTAAQRAAFAKVNARLGLGPDEITFSVAADQSLAAEVDVSAQKSDEPVTSLVLSSVREESDVPPHYVPVGSVAELRRLAGFEEDSIRQDAPDEHDAYYPEPLGEEEKELLHSQVRAMKPEVSPELQARIEKAAVAYVMLDPNRVREYEPFINAMLFPGQVAVFVSDNLVVENGQVVIIKGDGMNPVVVNYGNVTVKPGGCLKVNVHCLFTCQNFTQLLQPASTFNRPTWDFTPAPWPNPAAGGTTGPTGARGSAGEAGASHWDGGQTRNICDRPPKTGNQGGPGGTPAPPPKAQRGNPSPAVLLDLNVCRGPVTIWYGAGNGQTGGNGGQGGNGGPGGDPGNPAAGCPAASPGPPGVGGLGGNGGEGGDGGISQPITIYYYNANTEFNPILKGGAGGPGGARGNQGIGDGTRGPGNPGSPGRNSEKLVLSIKAKQ